MAHRPFFILLEISFRATRKNQPHSFCEEVKREETERTTTETRFSGR
jgi:hypothetical protein